MSGLFYEMIIYLLVAWSFLVVEEMKAGSAQAKSYCVCVKPPKIMLHMHGIIPQLFDCWANPVAHLLLLKSSMASGHWFKTPTKG